jgi:hypothetical protein
VSVKTSPQTLVKLLTDSNTHRVPIAAEEEEQVSARTVCMLIMSVCSPFVV